MKKYIYEGKNLETIKEKMLTELNCASDEVIIKEEENENQGLFGSKKYKITAVLKSDFLEYVMDKIKDITKLLQIETDVEYKFRGNTYQFQLISTNDAILIGKMGKNLNALEVLIKQLVKQELGMYINLTVDISGYKEQKIKKLEQQVKQIAREVKGSKVPAKLDPMNSYERRIVHTVLTDNKYVQTKSEGDEPNRCIVIEPKEE